MLPEQSNVEQGTAIEVLDLNGGGDPKKSNYETIEWAYGILKDNGYANKTKDLNDFVEKVKAKPEIIDFAYDVAVNKLNIRDIVNIDEFKQAFNTELSQFGASKKKAPTQPASGAGADTGLQGGQDGVTTPAIEITDQQQSLQAPSTEASQIVDPLNPFAPVTKEQKDIRALQTNQVGFIPEVNENDVKKATDVLRKEFDQRNWGFGMASNEQDKARRARERDRFVANNVDRVTRDYAVKRSRNEFIQNGLLDVSFGEGLERVKYVLRTDKGLETDQYEEQQAAATGKTKQLQDERNIRALSLYQNNLMKIVEDLEKRQPGIDVLAKKLYELNGKEGKSFNENVKYLSSLPDNVINPMAKSYLKAVDLLNESNTQYNKLLKNGLSDADKKDITDYLTNRYDRASKVITGRTAEMTVDYTGRYIAKPIIDGLLSIPKLISNTAGAKGYGWTDELSDKTVEATSNFFAKGGDRLLNKQTVFGESKLPKEMQISKPEVFADRLSGVLGFMLSLVGTGGAAAAVGATSKVGQAATMIGTAFATTHDGYFREGIASGLTPTQSARFALGAALAQSSLELVSPESRLFTGGAKGLSRVAAPISKAAIKEYAQALSSGSSMKAALAKGLKVMSKDIVQENTQEFLQKNADGAVKTMVNNALDDEKLETEFGYDQETAWLTTAATSIMGGMTIRGRVRSDLETSAYYNLVTQDYANNLVKLKEVLQEQSVPINEQEKLIGRLNAVHSKYESLKELGKNDEETLQLALATVDRDRIVQSMADMPQPVQQQMKAQVDELDAQVEQIVNGPNPIAKQPEPVAGQPAPAKLVGYGDLQDVVVDNDKKTIVAKAPKTGDEVLVGDEVTISSPDGQSKLKGRYVLLPISAAQPSHLSKESFAQNPNYPTEADGRSMNQRDYKDAGSQQKVAKIANNLEPETIITNYNKSDNGTPVLDAQMNVIGGNGRTMALQLLESQTDQNSQERLAAYQDTLLSEADKYGFSDDAKAKLASGKYMLARVVIEENYTWGKQESADMNRSSTQAVTSADIAARVTGALKENTKAATAINSQVAGAESTQEAITNNGVAMINALVSNGIITDLERPAYANEQGVTPEGRTLLENVYLGQVLPAQDVKYLYDNMNEEGSVRNAVLNSLPQIIDTRNLGDWSLVKAVTEAMEIYRTKQDVYNAATQSTIEGPQKSTLSALLATVFKRGSKQAREILKSYVEAASVSANSAVAIGEQPTPEKTLAGLLQPYIKDNTKPEYQLVERVVKSGAAPIPAPVPVPQPAPKPVEKPKSEPAPIKAEAKPEAKPETTKPKQEPAKAEGKAAVKTEAKVETKPEPTKNELDEATKANRETLGKRKFKSEEQQRLFKKSKNITKESVRVDGHPVLHASSVVLTKAPEFIQTQATGAVLYFGRTKYGENDVSLVARVGDQYFEVMETGYVPEKTDFDFDEYIQGPLTEGTTKAELVKALDKKLYQKNLVKSSTFTDPTPESTAKSGPPKKTKVKPKKLADAINPIKDTPIEEVVAPNTTGKQAEQPVVPQPVPEATLAQKKAAKAKVMASSKWESKTKTGNMTVEVFDNTGPETAVKVTVPADGWGNVVGSEDVNDTLYGSGFTLQGNVYVGYVKPGNMDAFMEAVETQTELEAKDEDAAAETIADARHRLAKLQKQNSGVVNSSPNTPLGKLTKGLIDQLKLAFPNLQVVTDPTQVSKKQVAVGTTSNAFVADGTIYLNMNAVDDRTLVEEFAHAWLELARVTNLDLYERILNKAWDDATYRDMVLNDPFYAGLKLEYKKLEAAAKAIADAGAAIASKSKWNRMLTALYDNVRAALHKSIGFLHPIKGLNFGKAKISDLARVAAKDLFRAADGELYKKNFPWIEKLFMDNQYWTPISDMTTQKLATLQGGGNTITSANAQSVLDKADISNTNQSWQTFWRTYFGTAGNLLGTELHKIYVKNIADKNRIKRMVTDLAKKNLEAVNAETDYRLKLAKQNNPNVSREDIYNQVDLDFKDAFTGNAAAKQRIQSVEGQNWLVAGRAEIDKAQMKLRDLEKQYGKALTTTPELMDVLFQQYLAKREMTDAETIINQEMEERIDKMREPNANLDQLNELYSNFARASLNHLKRLQAKLATGQAALLNQRSNSMVDQLQKRLTKLLTAYDIALVKQSGPKAAISQANQYDTVLADAELEQAQADLEAAQKALAGRIPTSQELALMQAIENTIALISTVGSNKTRTTADQVMDAIMRDAAQKRMISELKAQLVTPQAVLYESRPNNKFDVKLMFGDGTVHDVGELDEVTIKKLQGLGQSMWNNMVVGKNGMEMIARPDLLMNNYMLERYNESIGKYVTRSYAKFDRRTDWAKQAKNKIGAKEFAKVVDYLRNQLQRANPKSIVFNTDTADYTIINSAGVEARVRDIDQFIANAEKIGLPVNDIIGLNNLRAKQSSAFTFSYPAQIKLLANSNNLGLSFIATTAQVDDVIADIISQDAIAVRPGTQAGFNEGIFKQRKDVPEPIRILLGEVTSSNIALPATFEYVLSAVSRVEMEQALYDTDVISSEPTQFHTYQIRFFSPENTKGNVLLTDEKVGHRRDVYTTPEVAELLFNEMQFFQSNNIIRYMANVSAFFKRNMTVGSMGSQARNFLSSMYFRKLIGGRWGFASKSDWSVGLDAGKVSEMLVSDLKGWDNMARAMGLMQQAFQGMGIKFSSLTDQEVKELFDEVEAAGIVSSSLDIGTIKNIHEFLSGGVDFNNMSQKPNKAVMDKVSAFFDNFKKQAAIKKSRVVDAAERVYQLGDDLNKIAAYLYEKNYQKSMQKQTNLTDDQIKDIAAANVRATIPNYDEAFRIFRLIGRLPILASFPMYAAETFRCMYNVLEIGTKEMIEGKKTNNGKMFAQGAKRVAGAAIAGISGPAAINVTAKLTLAALQAVGIALQYRFLDDEEEEAFRELLPDFAKNNVFLIVKNIENDEITYVDISYAVSSAMFTQAYNAYKYSDGNVSGIYNALNELLKPFTSVDISANVLKEVLMNEDAYGNKIHKPGSQAFNYAGDNEVIIVGDQALKATLDYLSFGKDRGAIPKVAKELWQIGLGASGAVRPNGEPYNLGNDIANTIIGLKSNTFPVNKRSASVARSIYDEYQNYQSLVTGEVRDARSDAQDIEDVRKAQERNLRMVFDRIKTKVKSAKKLGLTDLEIFGRKQIGPKGSTYTKQGILSEAGIGSDMKEALGKALKDPAYVYKPTFSDAFEKRYKEAMKTR